MQSVWSFYFMVLHAYFRWIWSSKMRKYPQIWSCFYKYYWFELCYKILGWKNQLFCHEFSPPSVLSCTSPNGHGNDNNSPRWVLLLLEDTNFSLPQRPEDQWKAYWLLYYVFIDAIHIAWPYTVHRTRYEDSAPPPRIHILDKRKMPSKYEIS